MANRFLLFSKKTCGPCGLVDKYISNVKDERKSIIEKIDLEDFGDEPIPQENLDLAKEYGVTATPVLIVIDEAGFKLADYIGGMQITQNIRSLLNNYA